MWRVRSKLQASPTAIVEEANKPKLNGFYIFMFLTSITAPLKIKSTWLNLMQNIH